MKFDSIISGTDHYNFHSHTEYCDGRADMRTMAAAAVAAGMRHYGFSPHSPIPDYVYSACNMKADRVADYLAGVRAIQADPALATCRFYAAMEVDYIDSSWGPATDYFHTLGLDYIIGSVHFVPDREGRFIDIDGPFDRFRSHMEADFGGDIEYVVDSFYARTLAMIEAGGLDILGHFDKIGQNAGYYSPGIEDSSFYHTYIRRVIDAIVERDLTIELNTKARRQHGRFFPGERYLPQLVDAGVTIVVNSDAHYPDRIEASRAEALELLRTINHSRR